MHKSNFGFIQTFLLPSPLRQSVSVRCSADTSNQLTIDMKYSTWASWKSGFEKKASLATVNFASPEVESRPLRASKQYLNARCVVRLVMKGQEGLRLNYKDQSVKLKK